MKTIVVVRDTLRGTLQDNQAIFYLSEAPTEIPEADKHEIFDCSPVDEKTDSCIGREVYQRLIKHKAVHEALEQITRIKHPERRPFYIELRTDRSENLPWEAICCPQAKHLALDRRWPIARMVYRGPLPKKRDVRYFDGTLRITAILAAHKVDAWEEWEALYEAIATSKIPCRLDILTSQEKLIEDISHRATQHRSQCNFFEISVDWVPDKESKLIERIQDNKPNIVHFFCHGSSGYGLSSLIIATRATTEKITADPPLSLEAFQLAELNHQTLWLLTLNACETAKSSGNSMSLIYNLVYDGIPAAMGMHNKIEKYNANIFCKNFYQTILDEFSQISTQTDFRLKLENSLHLLRKAFCEEHSEPLHLGAKEYKEWTLPVLYIHRDPLKIQNLTNININNNKKILEEIKVLENILEELTPTRPKQQIIEGIKEQIENLKKKLN